MTPSLVVPLPSPLLFFLADLHTRVTNNHLAKSTRSYIATSILWQRNWPIAFSSSLRQVLRVRAESSQILCQSTTKAVSSPVANTVPLWNPLIWASTVVEASALLNSKLLLGQLIELCLVFNCFSSLKPQVFPHSSKTKNKKQNKTSMANQICHAVYFLVLIFTLITLLLLW